MTTPTQLAERIVAAINERLLTAELGVVAITPDVFTPIVERELAALVASQEALALCASVLEEAQNGLQWYQSEFPEVDSPADDEVHERIIDALAKASAATTSSK